MIPRSKGPLGVAQWIEILLELDLGTDAERASVEHLLRAMDFPQELLGRAQEGAVGLAGARDRWDKEGIEELEDPTELGAVALALALRGRQQLQSLRARLDGARKGEDRKAARALRRTRDEAAALATRLKATDSDDPFVEVARALARSTRVGAGKWLPRRKKPDAAASTPGAAAPFPEPAVDETPDEAADEGLDESGDEPEGDEDSEVSSRGPQSIDDLAQSLGFAEDDLDAVEAVLDDARPDPGAAAVRAARAVPPPRPERRPASEEAAAPQGSSNLRVALLTALLVVSLGAGWQYLLRRPPALPALSEYGLVMAAVNGAHVEGDLLIVPVDARWRQYDEATRNKHVDRMLSWVGGDWQRAEFRSQGIRVLTIDAEGDRRWNIVPVPSQ